MHSEWHSVHIRGYFVFFQPDSFLIQEHRIRHTQYLQKKNSNFISHGEDQSFIIPLRYNIIFAVSSRTIEMLLCQKKKTLILLNRTIHIFTVHTHYTQYMHTCIVYSIASSDGIPSFRLQFHCRLFFRCCIFFCFTWNKHYTLLNCSACIVEYAYLYFAVASFHCH